MYDYSCLPTLVPVMDRILAYLSVKERFRCKGVCRSWRAEIELRDRRNDTLVLHLGPYPLNIRWAETNDQRLMKFENSFQMKSLAILDHPLTRSLLKKTKKLAFVFYHNVSDSILSIIQPYLSSHSYLDQCEEIEIRGVPEPGTLTFNLPKLRVLVIKDSQTDKLVLNCPSLEVLSWYSVMNEIRFKNVKKLKRLICYGWPLTFSLKGKFSNLVYLNLFAIRNEPVSDRMLNLMPKLKRLVIYSNNLQADLKIIREQQKRLKNLEVLSNGFRDPVEMAIDLNSFRLMINGWNAKLLHENYSKLVENSPWRVCIDYSALFSKFKILPNNFFERFKEPFAIEISAVTNYTHLLGFLKCYPYLQKLRIHSKVDANRIFDLVHSLQPSLAVLTIVEERPLDSLKIDLSSLRLFKLIQLDLESTRLPVEFVRRAAVNRSPDLRSITFIQVPVRRSRATGLIMVWFYSQSLFLIVNNRQQKYSDIDQLITGMRNEPELRNILI